MYKLLMILGIVTNTIPRWIQCPSLWSRKSYYIGQALSFVLIIWAGSYKKLTTFDRIVYDIVLWLAISNLLDELIFDPVHFGYNELIFGILITGWSIIKYHSLSKTQNVIRR